jgi:hypothetical protein
MKIEAWRGEEEEEVKLFQEHLRRFLSKLNYNEKLREIQYEITDNVE